MKPQGILFRSRHLAAVQPQVLEPTPTASNPSPYRLTRCVSARGTFHLFRAATSGELGPGCYLLKTERPTFAQREVAIAMLRREMAVAASVRQPNLNCVLAADLESAQPYLLLPYHDGISLRQLLQSAFAPVSLTRALGIVRQVAEALTTLHAANWLHGEVRPQHILLSPQGSVTLIDFTLARQLETFECEKAPLTPSRALYAAPESTSKNHRLTTAAEVYSLGIILFEILAGRTPFDGLTPQKLLTQHCREAIPDIRSIRADVSLEVSHLLRLMLAKEPCRRPTDSQLLRWLADLEIAAFAL
jgi:serine/threonine protein kinase